ncbi:MAG: hypothetical protein ACFFG0_21760 [Candidatus Thorarchaeota archaeon]
MKNRFTNTFFEEIISKQTNKPTKIEDLKINGCYDDPNFSNWINRFKESMLKTTDFFLNDILNKKL